MLPRGWAALAVVAVLATSAHAQVSDELGIERFRVAVDRDGIADVEWADVPAHLHWDAGLLVGFAHAPLVLYDRDMNDIDALVERRLSTTLVGAIGLYDRVQVAASVDIVEYQSGLDGSTSPTMKSLPAGGLGDLRLLGKAKLAGDNRYHVALLATLTAPAGGSKGFLREAGVTFAPALAVSASQGIARGSINIGYLLRKDTETAGLRSADEGFVRVAVAAKVAEVAEVFTAFSAAAPLGDRDKNQVAIELFGGAGRALTPVVSAFVAGGAGLDNGFGTPDWRVMAGLRFGVAMPVVAKPPLPPVIEPPPPPEPKPIVVETKPASLEGRVVDSGGRPIARAVVSVSSSDGKVLEATADVDGWFTLTVPPGSTVINASAPEYQATTSNLDIESGATVKPTITLTRKVRQGQLRGQVLSFDGKPLAATITVTGATSATVTADAEGTYTVDLPQGAFQVEISADGYKTQKRNVSVKLDGVTVLNVDLRGAK